MLRAFAFAAMLVLLSILGCASAQQSTDDERKGDLKPFVDAVPRDRERPFADVTCPADALGTTRCRVNVSVSFDAAGKCKVDAPNITFDKPNRKYIVVWIPPSDDYRFCPLLGDGVTFKKRAASDDEQFDDGWAGDNAGDFGDGPNFRGKSCFKRFRIWAANSKPKEQYDYNVQFRDVSASKVCTVDPFIRNGN